jgi:hypothetical protein
MGVASAMMVQSLFKEQLLEFVEDREEPFNLEFLVESCNDRFIDENRFREALFELEEEGQVVKLNHHYLSTRVLMRRWIRREEKPPHERGLSLPQSLIRQVEDLLGERPELGYLDAAEFVRDAIRRFIQYHQAK